MSKPRLVKQVSLLNFAYNSLVSYGSPGILSYMWNFGSLAGFFLVVQIVTGIILAMHYTPHADLAFMSVEHIMRDVNNGWLIRYVHANGASFFFLVVYIHIFRGLYYGSYAYPRQWLWGVGVIILLLMILTAFLGYVLPWGQMSFWAATVITNLASAIPLVGETIVYWLWGGYAVDNPTLNRFFSLHFLLPFVILALVIIHLTLLHEYGSSNPLGINSSIDDIPLHPFYTNKDMLGINYCLIIFLSFVAFMPNYLGHTDNYIPADPMVTPAHIVPEWYFLPFYAILRSIPNKLGGVALLLLAIIVLFVFPFFVKPYSRSSMFRPAAKVGFWFFVVICLILGWIGGKPIETPYYELGQIATILYFAYFFVFMPFHDYCEKLILVEEKYLTAPINENQGLHKILSFKLQDYVPFKLSKN